MVTTALHRVYRTPDVSIYAVPRPRSVVSGGAQVLALRQASLVVHVSGHFDVGVYRLTVPADLIGFDSYVNGTAASRQSRRGALAHLQLSLLEAD